MIAMLLASALATPQAVHRSPDASHVRYNFVNDLQVSRDLVALSAAGAPPKVDLHTEIDLECDLEAKASRTEFHCDIQDIVVQSSTDSPAIQDWTRLTAATLDRASVDFQLTANGRVRNLDVRTPGPLVWPHRSMVMLVVERSVAGLDPELPRYGAVPQQVHRITDSWLPASTVLEQESRLEGRLGSTALFETRRDLLDPRSWRAQLGESQWYLQFATVQLASSTEPRPISQFGSP